MAISRFIYALSVPAMNETTQYFCSWVRHPTTVEYALAFTEDLLPIHPQANAPQLVDTIRHAITEDEATAFEDVIASGELVEYTTIDEDGVEQTFQRRDRTITPIDHIPPSLSAKTLTHEQATDQGWFADTSIEQE